MGAIKGLRVVLAALLCLVLGGSLWLTVQRQVFHQEELAVGGLILAPVEGDAMSPALEQGSLAVAVPREDYQLGDVVLYDAGFTRLVGSVEGDFIARGDAQGEEAEALLPTADIQGAVIAALPGGGEVWGFLSSLWGPPVVLVCGGAAAGAAKACSAWGGSRRVPRPRSSLANTGPATRLWLKESAVFIDCKKEGYHGLALDCVGGRPGGGAVAAGGGGVSFSSSPSAGIGRSAPMSSMRRQTPSGTPLPPG